jgi:ribose transport system substrate-binding protein
MIQRLSERRVKLGAILASVALLAPLAVLTVAGSATASANHSKKVKVTKLAIVYHVNVPAVDVFGYGAQAAANELGVHLDITGPQAYNVLIQQQLSNSEANAGAQGIEEILVGASAWARNISALEKRGIAVADLGVYTGPFLGRSTPVYVGPSDKAYGRALGKLLVSALGKKAHGTVVIGTCNPGLLELVQRIDGVDNAMKQYEPGVTVKSPVYATDSYSQGTTDWTRIVLANPNALAFVGLCSTAPADLAKVKASTHGKWVIVGGELDPGTQAGLKSGRIYGVVDARIWEQGYLGIKLLYDELTIPADAHLTGWLDLGIETVTHANIDSVIAREGSKNAQQAYWQPVADALAANITKHLKPLSASQS